MKTIRVWDVQSWDGGERHNHDFYLNYESTTEEQLKIYDKHGCFIDRTLIIVEQLSEIPELRKEKIRQRALAKLNAQERQALGLE
ncbi:hypothetical protein [Rhodoferax mekongensis]|uniref:Uncharacterized protein n=1 Tax=Rhodoferax mekongensis TaxID=3068341 RepID=A0ABZ0B321_9BURK|nr:hypothetical protein [Rhodoferax sp. TBRC 17307]WNO06020.1 hypothetical protein RAN89_06210 [Rhodoferax sp. TBRC 17307]